RFVWERVGAMRHLQAPFDLDEDPTPPVSSNPENWVLQLFTLVGTVLVLVSQAFGKDVWWFRGLVALFAGVGTVWIGSALWPRVVAVWARRRDGAKLKIAARGLYPEFLDVLKRFQRYADATSNRADNVPYVLWSILQQSQLKLPLDAGGIHYVGRFYDHLRERVPDGPPSLEEFSRLLEAFGDILDLYHRVYVLWPYRELSRVDTAQVPPHIRADLDVQRDDYNAFLRVSNQFGQRVNEILGEFLFPSYLEMLKPLA
ncbi:MAG: hypothetical protein ACYDAB_01930, partial [bacterium]